MSSESTDRIEKEIVLPSPRARVWRALTDPAQFGQWFGVALEDPFVPGEFCRGQMTVKNYEYVRMEILIDRIEAEHHFSFLWRPYALDPNVDYSAEPRTTIVFTLEEVAEGTRLTVTESGFDGIPEHRRAEAFRMNDRGWAAQLKNIERFLAE